MKTKTQKTNTALSQGGKSVKSSKETLQTIFEDLMKDIYWAENTSRRLCLKWQRRHLMKS